VEGLVVPRVHEAGNGRCARDRVAKSTVARASASAGATVVVGVRVSHLSAHCLEEARAHHLSQVNSRVARRHENSCGVEAAQDRLHCRSATGGHTA